MPFRSIDYDDPRWDDFVGLCLWCGRPVRDDEYERRDDGKACLSCAALLDGDLAPVEGER